MPRWIAVHETRAPKRSLFLPFSWIELKKEKAIEGVAQSNGLFNGKQKERGKGGKNWKGKRETRGERAEEVVEI